MKVPLSLIWNISQDIHLDLFLTFLILLIPVVYENGRMAKIVYFSVLGKVRLSLIE